MKLGVVWLALVSLLVGVGCNAAAGSRSATVTPSAPTVVSSPAASATPTPRTVPSVIPTPTPFQGTTYVDPFDYCAAVGDSPTEIFFGDDPAYLGDPLPASVAVRDSSTKRYSWRCARGTVERCSWDEREIAGTRTGDQIRIAIAQACRAPASWEVMSPPHEPTYRDPFGYCSALGTVDSPRADPKYRGDPFPVQISVGIFGAGPEIRGGWTWRCLDGRVLGCNIGTALLCFQPDTTNKVPSPVLVDYCTTSTSPSLPTAVMPKFTVYIWECRDKKPVITGEWALDSRGFIRDVWKVILDRP